MVDIVSIPSNTISNLPPLVRNPSDISAQITLACFVERSDNFIFAAKLFQRLGAPIVDIRV